MSFDFAPETGSTTIFNACIKVIGVGGGGGNAVEHMIDKKLRASPLSLPTPTNRRSIAPVPIL